MTPHSLLLNDRWDLRPELHPHCSGANSAVVAQHAVKGPPDTAATVGAAPSSKIFEGISIFVDGFTIPSHQVLYLGFLETLLFVLGFLRLMTLLPVDCRNCVISCCNMVAYLKTILQDHE